MKKILLILFLILAIIPKIVFAFEPPDPNRWYWAGSDEKIGVWIDKQTLVASKENNANSSCFNHRYVTSWEMWYNSQDKTTILCNSIYDLDCRKRKDLSAITYDEFGRAINSVIPASPIFLPIPPDTWGEGLLNLMIEFWNYQNKGQSI